jgi:Rieske Fe-S protein
VLKSVPDFPLSLPAERSLDRRRLLKLAGVAAVAALGAERFATHDPSPRRAVRVDALDPPAPGTARAVTGADGGEVLVARLDADTVVAFDRRCPHLGCPVVWSAEHARFECPCHHAAFDARTGRVLFGPPRRGLAPVAVTA